LITDESPLVPSRVSRYKTIHVTINFKLGLNGNRTLGYDYRYKIPWSNLVLFLSYCIDIGRARAKGGPGVLIGTGGSGAVPRYLADCASCIITLRRITLRTQRRLIELVLPITTVLLLGRCFLIIQYYFTVSMMKSCVLSLSNTPQ